MMRAFLDASPSTGKDRGQVNFLSARCLQVRILAPGAVMAVGARLRAFRLQVPIALIVLGFAAAHAQTPPPIDLAKARAYFAEDRAVSDKDDGRLWGVKLYGATFFVDPGSRFIVSNAPVEWEGKRWTMLMWPYIPEDTNVRRVMFAHESFHRIQPALHLMAPDTPSLHLDTVEGRLWIQLEWRALAAALVEKGAAQTQAIRDAILFRTHRRELFPGSREIEDGLEIAEGIPEYTGTVVGEPDLASARWRAVGRLTDPDQTATFVRFFAYISGPPYGMLLDERLPGWRLKLAARSDLGDLLASTLPGHVAASAEARAAVYSAAALRAIGSVAGQEAGAHPGSKRLIVPAPLARRPGQPGAEARPRDTERPAHPCRRPDPPVLRDEGEPHSWSFAK